MLKPPTLTIKAPRTELKALLIRLDYTVLPFGDTLTRTGYTTEHNQEYIYPLNSRAEALDEAHVQRAVLQLKLHF